MTEKLIDQERNQDDIVKTNELMLEYAGVPLQGQQFIGEIATLASERTQAAAMLERHPIPEKPGMTLVLGKRNEDEFDVAQRLLGSHVVLLPSPFSDPKTKDLFYPAIISPETSRLKDVIRLHVLEVPYVERESMQYGIKRLLSGSAQLELPSIGLHSVAPVTNGQPNVSAEAEHFSTFLSIVDNEAQKHAWDSGTHLNHKLRKSYDNSVPSKLVNDLVGSSLGISQKTISISRAQISSGQRFILWHNGLKDEETGQPMTDTGEDDVTLMQALGFKAYLLRHDGNSDAIKEELATKGI